MNQSEFNRRQFMKLMSTAVATSCFGGMTHAQGSLKLWAPGIARVGAQNWSDMEAQSGISISAITKSARADESIQKMIVGDGNALYDAMTDNGGGMEDILASQGAITKLDVSRIPNWSGLLPSYQAGGASADTIRHEGMVVGVPYISNEDSLAFNYGEIGEELTSWEALFDNQFRGRAAMQNDFGPTLTNTAIYLKQSGRGNIDNPADMTEDEVRQTCEFLIKLKKKNHFRTFWDGVQNGADLLSSEEVLVSSCWEVIQIQAARKNGQDIRYGTMKEGHQSWNNIVMLTRGGMKRGMADAFYQLANVYLSPWFGARTLAGPGFTPQMDGVSEYVDAHPDDFDPDTKAIMAERLVRKQERRAVSGNAWQNVFPTNIRAYQDWWARVQAA